MVAIQDALHLQRVDYCRLPRLLHIVLSIVLSTC